MEVTKIVQRINARMNYESYEYTELGNALDAAVDYINTEWRVNLPMITDLPETVQAKDDNGIPIQGQSKPAEYTNLPDEFIRQFVVPFAAAYQYTINELDNTKESQEAIINFGRLSERYGNVKPGITVIDTPNFKILTEDTKDQFGDGHNNYENITKNDNLGPFGGGY